MRRWALKDFEIILFVALFTLGAAIMPPCRPSFGSSYAARSRTRISELDDGCRQYRQDHKHFPGQSSPDKIGSGRGQLTGAQVLARAMFTKGATYPAPNYAMYKESDLLTSSDGVNYADTVSDCFPIERRPVLYYPARIGVEGVAQFVEADNAAIAGWRRNGEFERFIQTVDPPEQDRHPCAGEFLLIAPGPDREYFTEDDVTNWDRPLSAGEEALRYVTPLSVTVAAIVVALLVYVLWRKKRTRRMTVL